MNSPLRRLVLRGATLVIAFLPPAAASSAASLPASRDWYVGVEGGMPLGFSTFTAFGHDKFRAGYAVGVFGGYRFNPMLSAELSLSRSKTSLSARDCCVNSAYWVGADGSHYHAPVLGLDGWAYADLKSRVSLQKYGARLNVNLLGFFRKTNTSRWTLDASPALYAVGTKATFRTIAGNIKVKEQDTKWHLGYGGRLQAGYAVTRNLNIGIYTEITALTGKILDGMPDYRHGRNFIWESGVRVGWTFGKVKAKSGKVKAGRGEPAVLPLVPGREVYAEEPARPIEAIETVEAADTVAAKSKQEATAVTPTVPIAQETETEPNQVAETEAVVPIFPEVYFAFNSLAVSKREEAKLRIILKLLNEHPDMKVRLNGWCDTRGSVVVNRRISLRRAEAVKAWLVRRGIAAARIAAVGHGSDRRATAAAKARRVNTEQAGSVKVEINEGE